MAVGSGETGKLNLPNVPRQADVREGDLLVTSGLGDRFPGGYPVALVSAIDREEGRTFVHVEAEPLAALDRGREVLLIRVLQQEDPADSAVSDPTAETAGADEEESVATAENELVEDEGGPQ